MKILGYEINVNKAKDIEVVQNVASKPADKDILRKMVPIQTSLSRTRQDIATWRSALASAESVQYPNRTELYRLYNEIIIDAHLASLIDTRKKAILASKFIVTKNGKVKEEKTQFIEKKWFYDFTNQALDSIFWGYSLIQFGDFVNDEFTDITLIPRQYVKQEFSIVVNNGASNTGQSYLESPYKEWLIGIGEKRDLGLLAKAAPLVLWKKGALAAWAEYVNILGVPIRIGKTNSRDAETRNNMEAMLRDMGTSAWGVFDTEDIIELVESNSTSPFEIFDKLIERCNSELSKLILGQTSTSDQKAYVGSAGVHERVMHQVNEADEIFIENIYTYQLVPFLNAHGLGFNNLKIESEADDEVSLAEKAKIDIALLEFFDIPPEYILETYGTPVIAKAIQPVPDKEGGIDNVKDKLDEYYGSH